MNVLIASDNYILEVEGKYYCSNSFYKVVARYKKHFGKIVICTRVCQKNQESIPGSYVELNDLTNDLIPIKGFKQVLLGRMNSEIKQALNSIDLVVARVPNIIAYKVADIARSNHKPYLVEVVGCAWDAYWNYSFLGKIFAPFGFAWMKHIVAHSNFATYVTEQFLQKRYPCKCKSINCSNVMIPYTDDTILQARLNKIINKTDNRVVLFTAAAVDVSYKGQEYVIRAIPILLNKGLQVEYRIAGTGDSSRLRKIAKKSGVYSRVIFLGALPHDKVFSELDNIDIYVQPSLQEGLPRSVIEAMSRACPTIGARTAGIPELISENCVVKRANPRDTAEKIYRLYSNEMTNAATENFQKSKEYLNDFLETRRAVYYKEICEIIGESK